MISSNKLQIVIPIHKSSLNEYETISLNRCFKILSHYTITMIKPEGLDTSSIEHSYNFSNIEIFDSRFFDSISSYNHLLLSTNFYKRFEKSEYILILQPDVYIFTDNLPYWIEKGYDYTGAPWISSTSFSNSIHRIRMLTHLFFTEKKDVVHRYETRNRVGNGGFSLRKVSTHIKLSILMKENIKYYEDNQGTDQFNEDIFWSIEPQKKGYDYTTPSAKEARNFAFDINPKRNLRLNNHILPMACHGWFKGKRLKFWMPIITEFDRETKKNTDL